MRKETQQRAGGRIEELQDIREQLNRIEDVLQQLQLPKREKYFYSTGEVAARLGLSKWHVRRLCSLGEIEAEKHPENGRFLVSAKELQRIESRRDALK